MFEYLAPVFILGCWKWGDWKNWRLYYPTILYVAAIDLLTNFLTARYPLWEYDHIIINHTFSNIFIILTVMPSTVILFLSRFPAKIGRQIAHIVIWVILYSTIEYISFKLGLFIYKNSWNAVWSTGFNIVMFIMMRLHFNKPLLALPLSAVLMIITLAALKLPVGSMR